MSSCDFGFASVLQSPARVANKGSLAMCVFHCNLGTFKGRVKSSAMVLWIPLDFGVTEKDPLKTCSSFFCRKATRMILYKSGYCEY